MIEITFRIGETLADGRVYAGVNPLNGKALFTIPRDYQRHVPWHYAFISCHKFQCGPHRWRLPSQDELNVLWLNRAGIGNFEEGYYWCSFPNYMTMHWCQEFKAGRQTSRNPKAHLFFRPVCGDE